MNCPLCGLPTPTRLDVHGDIYACVRSLGQWRTWVQPYLEKADAAVREMTGKAESLDENFTVLERRVLALEGNPRPPSDEDVQDLHANIAALSLQVGDLAALVEGREMVMREAA